MDLRAAITTGSPWQVDRVLNVYGGELYPGCLHEALLVDQVYERTIIASSLLYVGAVVTPDCLPAAVESGESSLISLLLKAGAKVYPGCLLAALLAITQNKAITGDQYCISLLLKAGAEVTPECLPVAVQNKLCYSVVLLLDAGASVYPNCLSQSHEKESFDVLIKAGAEVNSECLLAAFRAANVFAISRLLQYHAQITPACLRELVHGLNNPNNLILLTSSHSFTPECFINPTHLVQILDCTPYEEKYFSFFSRVYEAEVKKNLRILFQGSQQPGCVIHACPFSILETICVLTGICFGIVRYLHSHVYLRRLSRRREQEQWCRMIFDNINEPRLRLSELKI